MQEFLWMLEWFLYHMFLFVYIFLNEHLYFLEQCNKILQSYVLDDLSVPSRSQKIETKLSAAERSSPESA